MRAEEGDESIQDYAAEAAEAQDRVAGRSWWTRLRDVLGALNPLQRHRGRH
ncbi:hypothetical protein MTER_00630 [Mycolicibacter terrae]|jgi:hypothetical protein|uniref:Uncharacterized protein n=1 Tax=Mycolicibacter terrae TaxID=1788 RepID=A0AAD1MDV7_9MYCO|nr:hypothetical protein [Mycolicibacter terrae]BBX20652.1 hypothetical protein MTER_00630 [Mycolicibacter terrae]SNV94511.1 Uncharacterised protein [Mycolicibacter terrae]